jgi:NAD kinase
MEWNMSTTETTPNTSPELLVVLKETVTSRADARVQALMRQSSRGTADEREKEIEHVKTVDSVLGHLDRNGIKYDTALISAMPKNVRNYKRIATIGGDGTFLGTAPHAGEAHMLGVRSTVGSVAKFSLADRESFPKLMDEILSGKRLPLKLMRLKASLTRMELDAKGVIAPREVVIDGPVLNELFISHIVPAASTKYILEHGSLSESHENSGIWIATPSGCTGGARSAGGTKIPVAARKFEYVTQSLYIRPDHHYKMYHGIVDGTESLTVISRMESGKLYLDGQHRVYDFNIDDVLVITAHPDDLNAFMDANVNDRYPFFKPNYLPWGLDIDWKA